MKIIIAGSRDLWIRTDEIDLALQAANWMPTEIVSGGARGVDTAGEFYAKSKRLHLAMFPAEWDRLGRRAGFVRNERMAHYADALLAVWDGSSRGTLNMIECMQRLEKPVHILRK